MVIRVVTLYNKPDYVQTAIECVRQQTRADIQHYVTSDNTQDWGDRFPPSAWVNDQWKRAEPNDYCIWLSDDDWWHPIMIEVLAGYLDKNQEVQACYTASRHILYDIEEGELSELRVLGGDHQVFNAGIDPGGVIDGGQVLVRKSALDRIEYPYQPEAWGTSRLCDAMYLRKLVVNHGIYPTNTTLMESRTTDKSMHTRRDGLTYYKNDWWNDG